jgi:putative addiction module component (TIGR02574 family)
MFVASDIEHMTVAERFQAMDVIWGSFLKSPEDLSSPAWHGQVLSERLAKVEAGHGKFLTLEELKGRLGKTQS